MMVHPPAVKAKKFLWATIAYVAVLYGTLSVTPYFFLWFRPVVGGAGYRWSITVFLMMCGLAAVFAARRALFPPTWKIGAALVAIGAGYGLIFWAVQFPVVRLHTMQYGLLAWLVRESLGRQWGPSRAYPAAFLVLLGVAVGDEMIQGTLSNRDGAVMDVLLDGVSAALALAFVFLVTETPRPKENGDSPA